MNRASALILAGLCALACGCAKKPAVREAAVSTTAARVGNVNVSDEIMRRCNIQFGNVDRAPKFDYDEAALLPEDRDVLEQVARCLTTGPLKGRHVGLVGRADPRGEIEYNMVLGEHRADTVRDYLTHLGIAFTDIAKTSRGELDAQGHDEESWRADRRVDIVLQ
jgi:peptidoglycan-associated lipoprotein